MTVLCRCAVPLARLPTRVAALAVLGGAALASPCAGAPQKTSAPAPCTLEPFASGTVRAVIDGRTFVLADGREVRLDGIEVPPLPASSPASSAPSLAGNPATGPTEADPGLAAAAALRALLLEREVVLKSAKPGADRYGRLLADAVVRRAAGEDARSVTKSIVAQGLGRIGAHPGNAACLAELRAAEDVARTAKLGLWGDPRYFPKQAEDAAGVSAERGRFTVVEGKVVSVRESGGTIYVNFGRRWSEDFTVTILKRKERLFSAAGLEPRQLTGRRVRVRGWIEERGGPWIDASAPEQIEIVADK